ncbi:DUF2271 domain-containing protein [Aeoliella mucimassa]|nr:DUF2271 domain-containing protein [Aeoliella mucimassa]
MNILCVSRRVSLVLLLVISLASTLGAEEFSFHHENVLGTSLDMKVAATNQAAANKAEQVALAEIDRLNLVLSSYTAESELSQFAALENGESMRVSKDLAEALDLSEQWTTTSQGVYNPAVELLTQQWTEAAKEGTLPTEEALSSVVQEVEQTQWRVMKALRRATRTGNAPLCLNAIAKGMILDRAAEKVIASSKDVTGVMLNIGGDIRVAGELTVPVAIADPKNDAIGAPAAATFPLTAGAVATSGDSERGWTIDDKHYSHLIDPRTGKPATQIVSAAVMAQDAATADVLATICSILPPEESMELIRSIPRVECRLETVDGKVTTTKGWGEDPASKSAPQSMEMTVEFEIARPANSGRYRRPYVAVWVEDESGFPVKTLSLFLMQQQPGPRWYRDLRRWYSADQARKRVQKVDLITTISKPSRNPGSYRVAWDGNDELGKPVPAGVYTLFIESAREHGSYVLMKHSFDLSDGFSKDLEPNSEISSAKIRYTVGSEGK